MHPVHKNLYLLHLRTAWWFATVVWWTRRPILIHLSGWNSWKSSLWEKNWCVKTDIIMSSIWWVSVNSILLHSGLNPAWHFWLSTRFSCYLKMKSVENILRYIWEQFYRFSRGCKPQENVWNFSRKYIKMIKTDSFLGNKKLSFNQNVWRDHATMQQDILLHFGLIFLC